MLPKLVTEIPGPESLRLARELKQYECQNVTYTSDDWPVFWQRAEGVNVWDEDGNRLLDMTSAFGVAGLGHGWAGEIMREQSEQMIHAMGDVHPTGLKVEVCRLLSHGTYERWGAGRGKTTLSNSGFEAVETALKTARLASGRDGIATFRNGYHGLGYGALLGGGFDKFRDPFASQLAEHRILLDYPVDVNGLDQLVCQLSALDKDDVGAILVEPIQGRGGKIVPPEGFLQILRDWCDEHEAFLIFDEIYTGFNRTGKLFACEWEGVVPDLICVGKAMSGGYPISACVGKEAVMEAWPESEGEALHTSTYLGNPVGCAMSIASIREHLRDEIKARVEQRGNALRKMLEGLVSSAIAGVRGRGLMQGVELVDTGGHPASDLAGAILGDMLKSGVIMLADSPYGHVLAFTPPFCVSDEELAYVMEHLQCALDRLVG